MKKVTKNSLAKITSRIGLIILCVMLVLVARNISSTIFGVKKLTYGPYTCGTDTLVIQTQEHRNALEGVTWSDVSFLWNGEMIPTTENYNFEGVQDFFELPWTDTCSPLIIQKPDISKALGTCLKTKIEDGTIERERLKKRGLPLALCGIGYADPSKKYD